MWLVDLALFFAAVALDRRLSGRLYTPLTIFAAAWLLPLALRHMNLVDYEPLNPATSLAIYGGFGCYLVGHSLMLIAAGKFWRPMADDAVVGSLNLKVLTTVCVLAAAGGLAATIAQVMSVIGKFGLIGFLASPLEVREEFTLSGWGALFLLNAILPTLLVLRYRRAGDRADWLTVILTTVAIISLLLANQKQALVKAGVMAATVATLSEQRIRFRTLVVAVSVMLLFFVGYARVTSPYYQGDHRFYVRDGHIHLPHALAPLGNPYHYLTSGYGNLQVLEDDLEYETEGRQTLRPVRYIWLRLQGTREIETHHGRYYYAPLFGNTHTYLAPFISDGGIPLALLASGLIGFFVAWIYVEIVWRGRAWLAPLYGVFGWCLFISFFNNHWTYFGTWILGALALAMGLLTVSRPRARQCDVS